MLNIIQLKDGRIASCSEDYTIHIWNLIDNSNIELKGHTDIVYNIIQLKDGRIVSCSADKTIRIWNLNDCSSIKLNVYTSTRIIQLKDGRIVSFHGNGAIYIWNLNIDKISRVKSKHNHYLRSMIQLKDERIVCCSYTSIYMYNIK